jgi:hypothetical protein
VVLLSPLPPQYIAVYAHRFRILSYIIRAHYTRLRHATTSLPLMRHIGCYHDWAGGIGFTDGLILRKILEVSTLRVSGL